MVKPDTGLLAAFDTSGEIAGAALLEDGLLLAEATWRSRQNHSRELLPTLEWLLARADRTKDLLGAVAVCLGPGSYAGLRVGLSTAKALAFALEIPVVGIGRLEAEALTPALASGRRVVAVQAAGRAELAWAAYRAAEGQSGNRAIGQTGSGLRELVAPRLDPAEGLLAALETGDIVCGELRTLDAALLESIAAREATAVESATGRAVAVARLARLRLEAGAVDNADTLVPLYLRAPAIGPQH
jgi:tRNA threonylcarbamoyl adenosine modification protein YeaZ